MSLGINISGQGKFCSFNCPYCFRGKNQGRPDNERFLNDLPSCNKVLEVVGQFLKEANPTEVRDWTLAGNAEPTDHPNFPDIVRGLIDLRDRHQPLVKLTVLTNGVGLIPRLNPEYRKVVHALNSTDRACLKLDSGVAATWKQLARPYSGIDLKEWLAAARNVDKPIVQTMLINGRINNSGSEELQALIACYQALQAKDVQLLTLNKEPIDDRLKPVSGGVLQEFQRIISTRVEET